MSSGRVRPASAEDVVMVLNVLGTTTKVLLLPVATTGAPPHWVPS